MKFGLIGIGAIGSVRASALRRTKGCELVVVHDLDAVRARALAPQAEFHATVASLFASTECEAVIISTPPQFHEQLAVEALRNGKHVLVEKPMAPTVDACRRMIEAAAAAGRILTIGFNHRYFAALKLVRDVVQSGELGRLSHVRGHAGHTGLSEFKAPWMYDGRIMGGGTLMDNGIHLIDLMRYVMGDFVEVYGHALNRVWKLNTAEDNALALFRSSEGVVGSLHSSWSEWKGYRFYVEAYGERGMARAYYAPMMATVIRLDKPGGVRKTERHFYLSNIVREKFRGWQSTVIETFIEEFNDFAKLAQGQSGSGRIATAVDGLRSIEVAHALYMSERDHRPVMLDRLD